MPATAALAAAIIEVRRDTSPAGIRRAIQEAGFALFPEDYINDEAFNQWKIEVDNQQKIDADNKTADASWGKAK
jgi:hypothetical protein